MSDQVAIEKAADAQFHASLDAMNFKLPEAIKPSAHATATYLRLLEQEAPKNTQKDILQGLIQAAKELEAWHRLAEDTARQLEEAANVRISQMASTSRVVEIQNGVRSTLLELARTFRELA